MECIEWKAYEKGLLRGFADINVEKWGIILKGCKMFMKDGKRWVTPPSTEFTNEKGEKKYNPSLKFIDPEFVKAFSEKAVKAIETYCKQPEDKEDVANDLPF
jgi:hypothetical protein